MSLTITKLSNGKVRFDEVGGLQRNYDANYDVAESTRADYIVILAPEGNRLEEFKFSDVTQLVDAEGGTVDNPDLATLLEELSTNYFDGSGLGGGGSSAVDINKQRFEMSSKFSTRNYIAEGNSVVLYDWFSMWNSANYEVKNLVTHKVTITGWYSLDDGNDTAMFGALIGGEYLGNSDFTQEVLDGESADGTAGKISDPERLFYAMENDSTSPDGPHSRAQIIPIHIERTYDPSSLGVKNIGLSFIHVNPDFNAQFSVEIEEIKESGGVVVLDQVTKTGNGFIDYNDATGGVSLTANTWTDIPNDGAGAFTNKNYPATGVTELMDTSTGYIDCSELTLGDTILVRNDFKVDPSTNNALLEMRYELGNGGGVYTLETILGRLDSGSGQDYRFSLKPDLIYMGDTNTRDNPIKIQVRCSANATLTNAGSVIQVIKR